MAPPVHPVLLQINGLDKSLPTFDEHLNVILHGRGYIASMEQFKDDDLEWFLNYLDKTLCEPNRDQLLFRKCLRELKTLCRENSCLPTSWKMSSDFRVDFSWPLASGGFGDIFKGTCNGSAVCVKRLRVPHQTALVEITRKFCEEVVMWKYLKHDNILPLLGIYKEKLLLISPWIESGEVLEYITANPEADRIGLLSGVADGLCYLHSQGVIHGAIEEESILVGLVDGTPRALIKDFGIAIVTMDQNSLRPATRQQSKSLHRAAPEVLSGENPNKESDVYSLGMVLYRVFADEEWLAGKPGIAIAMAVLKGERPPRPTHPDCTNHLWALIQRCWGENAQLRPKMPEVLQELQSLHAGSPQG